MEDIIDLLERCVYFSSIPKKELKYLSSYAQHIELLKNEFLYRQNDPSDFIYVLISGKLVALAKTANDKLVNIETLSPGILVGELGVLSGEPRGLTMMAETNANLIRIPNTVFGNICDKYPSVLHSIMPPILKRVQKAIQVMSGKNICKYTLVFPANLSVKTEEFYNQIQSINTNNEKILFISDSGKTFPEFLNQCSQLEDSHDLIVVLSSNYQLYNHPQLLDKVNKVCVVAHELSDVVIDETIKSQMINIEPGLKIRYEIILLHEATSKINDTMRWLKLCHFACHHHATINNVGHYHRLIRGITGSMTGLVLGGGGVRGWAHIGVIKALEEMNITIDAIGGSSVGALIAACYVKSKKYSDVRDMFEELTKIISRTTFLKEMTWPMISFFTGKHPTKALQKIFQEMKIEDLDIPYFCVSANLSTREDVMHTTGSLWEMLRASNSIPGIVPPMVLNGQLHFDGGLVNNIPTDRMRDLLGHKGKVIVSSLSSLEPDEQRYNFPPILTCTQAILKKLNLAHRDYVIPPFLDTFLGSLLMGSSLKEQQTITMADVLIKVKFERESLLFLKNMKPDHLIELGYCETLNCLKNKNVTS
ncbi:MAG: patatin-like phospholipase family protein [Gammaproteobacteria bacterium]|nr:patatin-like phospholipase family protein [Gammaproteobacteria bacterium]MCW5584062.1 patatin-like phospholipase family protein [Gammaproteobacteria bacterium]